MRKYLIFLLTLTVVFSSCKKDLDESVFDESPDTRLQKTLDALQAQLSGSATGWTGILTPAGGGTYSFYFKFSNNNRVVMYSDFNSTTATVAKESSWRVKAMQQPSLIFDTYSYIHLLADPKGSVNGGANGAGLSSDFEFAYDPSTAQADTIKLTGRFNGSTLTLARATQATATAINNGGYRSILFENISKYQNYFKRVRIGNIDYQIEVNPVTRIITFTWVNVNGVVQTFSTKYYYSPTDVVFITPFVVGTTIVTGFSNVQYDAANIKISFAVNGSASSVEPANQPVKIDSTAPQRWWNEAYANANTYWYSWNGFHVNGVDDAFNVKSIVSGTSTYYYYIYWPAYYTNPVDRFLPALLTTANSLTLSTISTIPDLPTYTDGKAIFKRFSSTGTTVAGSPQDKSNLQLYNSGGYYFVQKGPKAYDMVLATDSKVWISWVRN